MADKPLLFTGFNKAFVGSASQGPSKVLAVYDYQRMVRVLKDRDGMDDDEAIEFLEFNTVGAWVGEQTPLILRRMSLTRFLEETGCDTSSSTREE